MGMGMGGGYSQTTTTVSGGFPQAWNRVTYNYTSGYNRYDPFVAPMGLDPSMVPLFMQGSQVFRTFDTDCSGQLSKKEFKRAMMALGISFSKGDCKRLFYMVDTDRSGRVNEREFVEFWVYMKTSGFSGGMGGGMGGGMAPMGGGMMGAQPTYY